MKSDKTLLTQADTEIQKIVIDTILEHDRNANFVAEEEEVKRLDPNNKYTWIIDPIDGTRPFTTPTCNEYCCAVCVLEKGMPIAAMLFMPEMDSNHTSVLAIALYETREIFMNGKLYDYSCEEATVRLASTTREAGSSPSKIEEYLTNSGVTVKHRTTSQSWDLLRTAIDISPFSDLGENHFSVFYREKQKVWDGAPGICFNRITGKKAVDLDGNEIIPYSDAFLAQREPTSSAVIVAYPNELEKLLSLKS